MLEILFSFLNPFRIIGIWIDSIAFSLVDNIYDLIYAFASATFFEESMILTIMNNTYIVISIFALFRIALILVNAMINPDKLSDKENGIGSVLRNLVIMFVLLIFTPLLFREANYIQSKVVEGNYIQKIFLPDNAQSASPGMEMKKISMGALIHPDDVFATYDSTTGVYTPKDTCTGKCETAVNDYNTMMQGDGKGMFSVFTKHIGRSEKVDEDGDGEKETVYVYTYMFIVTFVVGVFITYILFTFGLDIAIRAVELAVLQMIAPLFIVTYIDPKSAKTGPFHNWLKTVGKTYASLFIKLAILSLMIMFISLIDKIKVSDNVGFIGKLVILLAILIFAKKAPKWIGEMIGVDGETSGLGGLGKKIGSAALVGGALTKAGHGLAGATAGAISAGHNQLRARRADRKAARNKEGLNKGIGKKAREARNDWYGKTENREKYAGMSKRKAIKAARSEAYAKDNIGMRKDGIKAGAKQFGASIAAGIIGGGRAGVSADNLKGAFTGSVKAANQFGQQVGLSGKGVGQKISDATDRAYEGLKGAYGNSTQLREAREAKELEEKTRKLVNSKYISSMTDNSSNGGYNLEGALKQGKYTTLAKEFDKHGIIDKEDVVNTMATLAIHPNLKISGFDAKEKILTFNDGTTERITGKAGYVFNDAGQANVEQMYMNRGNQVLSEREQYNSTIKNTQSAINEAVAANTALRSFSVNMPDGGKLDLSFRTMDELSARINQAQAVVNSGAPKEDDYKRETRTTDSSGNTIIARTLDKEAFESAQLEFQKSSAIYESLIRSKSAIEQNIEIANNNDLKIQSDQEMIKKLEKIIKDQKMDEVVQSLADAVKVDNVYNVEGIRDGVSRETTKASERIKAADKKKE